VEEVMHYEETGELPELSEEEEREIAMLEAANEVEQNKYKKEQYVISGKIELNTDGDDFTNCKWVQPEITGKGTKEDPVTVKRNRGRQPLANADKRDARILELLQEGKKGVQILKIMKGEGYSVFAPQITKIKQANDL
jgi:hypothetical protein